MKALRYNEGRKNPQQEEARNKKMKEKLEVQLRELAGMIDHTILKPDATKQKVLEVCQECMDYHFKICLLYTSNPGQGDPFDVLSGDVRLH